MFFNLFKYRVKGLMLTKDLGFWTFAFPIILGTLFYFGFGNLMGGKDIEFSTVPVAIVVEQENSIFETVLDGINTSEEDVFSITKTDRDTAVSMLNNGDVSGIIYENETPHVEFIKEGIEPTIIKTFLDQYLQQESLIKKVIADHPEKINDVISTISKDITFNQETSLTDATLDPYVQYFYALIAMACLYGSIIGLHITISMQANLSALGQRREASPTHKLTIILSDFAAGVIIQFSSILLLMFYLIAILKIDFGNKTGLIIITGFVGSILGVSSGIFIGSIGKWSENTKNGIIMSYAMICSFLSGLMINSMKYIVEKFCPIINRINPAALITDCFYSLNIYNTYTRFAKDMAIMLVIAAFFCISSYFLLRRNTYASL